MRCVVIADNFRKALSVVERSVGKDQTTPILNSYLLSVARNTLNITGTNLETGIKISIRANAQQEGSVVVPARQLSGYISTLQKDDKITLESQQNDVVLTIGQQETVFKGYQPEDYPPFPSLKPTYTLTCKKNELSQSLVRVAASSAKTSVKPELSSISFSFERELLTLAATDSFRLSEEKIKPVKFSTKLSKASFLLPVSSAEELVRFFEYSDDDITELSIGKGEMIAQSNDATLYSRLTEGTFPDYQQIIPQKFSTNITTSRQLLVNHIRRASVFANKLSGISLTVNAKNNSILFESKNTFGTHRAEMPAMIHGEPVTAVFNYHYLLDGVESYKDETILWGFNGDAQPLVMKTPKKENFLYIAMPMKNTGA